MIEPHFWIEIHLKLDNQIIQIKTLVCDSECPYDIVLSCTSLAQLSAWQDYASRQLFIQQISIPLTATNNVTVLPGCTGIVSLALKLSKTSFVPCHMIIGKGIAYVKPLDLTLPLRPVKIEFENNRCCLEVHLKLKDETPVFVRPYPMREEQKKVMQKEMDRLEHLGIIQKGLTGYSPVVLVKRKNQNLYRFCSDFRILNEKLLKINHAFPLVRDCIEQLGRKRCHYLSTIDLRDAFHTL